MLRSASPKVDVVVTDSLTTEDTEGEGESHSARYFFSFSAT